MMLFLETLSARHSEAAAETGYPFSVPSLASIDSLTFRSPITLLAGDNGSGKSTLLEGIAAGMDAYAIGSHGQVISDPYLPHARTVAKAFYFSRKRHARIRMFMRAEDVLGYIRWLNEERLEETLHYREQARRQGADIPEDPDLIHRIIQTNTYDTRSHGEGFLDILSQRLHGTGLFLLDEPESPLSPQSQLQLAQMIRQKAEDGAQFIIATHSPILLGIPEATILHFGQDGIEEVTFRDLKGIQLLRRFLSDPLKYFGDDSADQGD